jgi:hypothetical protein
LIVRINASLDPSSGLATWRFTSLDPNTGLPVQDVQSGFLPPDASPPNGEGSVSFIVQPKAGVATGTQIANQATVLFDANAPITTQAWTNTIDSTPPVSLVQALPPTQTATNFQVQWSGTDVGAGIEDFDVYVSQDAGPFTLWLVNTSDTSATYTGQAGHSYGFYSIAHDQVGNVENAKTAAEATTKVVGGSPPTTTATASPAANAAGWNNTNIAVQLSSTASGGAQVQ